MRKYKDLTREEKFKLETHLAVLYCEYNGPTRNEALKILFDLKPCRFYEDELCMDPDACKKTCQNKTPVEKYNQQHENDKFADLISKNYIAFMQHEINTHYQSLTKFRKEETEFEIAFRSLNQLEAFDLIRSFDYTFASVAKSISAESIFEAMESILREIEEKKVVNGIVAFKKPAYLFSVIRGYNYTQQIIIHPSNGIPFELLIKEEYPCNNVITLTLEFVIISNE